MYTSEAALHHKHEIHSKWARIETRWLPMVFTNHSVIFPLNGAVRYKPSRMVWCLRKKVHCSVISSRVRVQCRAVLQKRQKRN